METEGFEDYSVYGSLTDDELMQLAIERSLEPHKPAGAPPPRSPPAPQRPPAPPRSPPAPQRPPAPPQSPPTPQPRRHSTHNPPVSVASNARRHSTHNPPREEPPDLKNFDGTVSRFVTGGGQHMVAYRSAEGNIVHVGPEPEEEEEPIFQAIRDGDVAKVRRLAHLPETNLMLPSKPGWLALHEAAYYGQERCLGVLLGAQPGMVNTRTLAEQTALMVAVDSQNVACVSVLLGNNADPDLMNNNRETPLYRACEKDDAEMVAVLLNHRASVNASCNLGMTALHEAVYRNNLEICEMLVAAGAKVGAANMYGITPLFMAAQSGCVGTLRFILKHGADINSQANDGNTALYEATKNGRKETVEFLLSQKADANQPGRTGLLPLHIAAERGFDDIVDLLIPVTSKPRVRRAGISPLHLAVEHNMDDILEALITAGFDVNQQLSQDRCKMYEDRRSTALYFAVYNNNTEATAMLLGAGADPNLDLFSPLLVAVRQGCMETVAMLVEHGADVNAYIPTHPTTFPAAVMFCMKYLSLLKYLMDHGGDARACFSCVHGSGPHPPLQLSPNMRDPGYTEHYTELPDTVERESVQFCEVISAPSISNWAGPVIDVLLNYVGRVKLCSRLVEHLDSYPDWGAIKQKASPLRPLMQLCRLKIRQLVGARLQKLPTLPLPGTMVKFLQYDSNTFTF